MGNLAQDDSELSPGLTCGECAHTFRKKFGHDTVVCVPHLKAMLTGHFDVCKLHLPKDKKSGTPEDPAL